MSKHVSVKCKAKASEHKEGEQRITRERVRLSLGLIVSLVALPVSQPPHFSPHTPTLEEKRGRILGIGIFDWKLFKASYSADI